MTSNTTHLPCLLLLAAFLCLSIAGGEVNHEAVRKQREKREWRSSTVTGCRPRQKDSPWWCERDGDDRVLIHNIARLVEVGKKAAKVAEPSPDDVATVRLVKAWRKAERAFAKDEKKKARKREKKNKKKGKKNKKAASTALPVPTSIKCRKSNDRKHRTMATLQWKCFVQSSKTPSDGSKSKASTKKKDDESPEERCARFGRWRTHWRRLQASKTKKKTPGSGDDAEDRFFEAVTADDPTLEALARLKAHADAAGTGMGKVRQALEKKAKQLYRTASLRLHPDKVIRKLPADCTADGDWDGGGNKEKKNKEELMEMLRAVFQRAKQLKECVVKPLRCEIEQQAKDGLFGDSVNAKTSHRRRRKKGGEL